MPGDSFSFCASNCFCAPVLVRPPATLYGVVRHGVRVERRAAVRRAHDDGRRAELLACRNSDSSGNIGQGWHMPAWKARGPRRRGRYRKRSVLYACGLENALTKSPSGKARSCRRARPARLGTTSTSGCAKSTKPLTRRARA